MSKAAWRDVNFLESFAAFTRLKRGDKDAFMELVRIEGQSQAECLRDSLLGYMGFNYSPVMWWPGQAKWVLENIPELRSVINNEFTRLGMDPDHFSTTQLNQYDSRWIEIILGRDKPKDWEVFLKLK